MYTADIRVTAQYEENYSDSATPYWKPKGGVEFIIRDIEPDPIMYAAPGEADSAIQILLDERSNIMCKYTLIDWEFIFAKPVELDADAFLFEMGIGMD